MTRFLTIAVLLAGTALASAQDAIPLIPVAAADGSFDPPAELVAKGGVAMYVPPATVKSVKYIALDAEEPFDVSAIGGNANAFVQFTRGLPAGAKYRFVGVASDKDGVQTRKDFTVTIPGAPVPPPVPVPPTPTPPVPPEPTFPVEMRTKLQAAYTADGGPTPGNEDVRRELRVLYETAAKIKLANDPGVVTTKQLIDKMREAAGKMTNDQLYTLRSAVGQEYVAPLLTPDTPLTAEKREAAHRLFGQLAAALAW